MQLVSASYGSRAAKTGLAKTEVSSLPWSKGERRRLFTGLGATLRNPPDRERSNLLFWTPLGSETGESIMQSRRMVSRRQWKRALGGGEGGPTHGSFQPSGKQIPPRRAQEGQTESEGRNMFGEEKRAERIMS